MSTSRQHVIGKGGHGGALPGAIPVSGPGDGHGHRHGGFRHWGGGPRWRGGPWLSPFIYEVPVASYGIDLDQLLAAAEEEDQKKEDTKALAKEIVKELKSSGATVGEDLDLLDAEIVGESGGGFGDFGLSSIFNLAGNLAQGGLSIYDKEMAKREAESAKQQASAAEQAKLQAAIIADSTATQAAAKAAFSAGQKLSSAQVDQVAAQQAAVAQARAGAGLSPESVGKRIEAAEKALSAATQKAQVAPKDAWALAMVRAWQTTLNKLQNAQIVSSSGPGAGAGGAGAGGGWLSQKTGPVPNKVIAGGGAVAAALLLFKALRS